ncbi:uncharacterized protein DSM5745_04495 [Aspergillus mulundensis]|uniref:Uncharacterized protein n=1 Tax=Aspergillus mulundensis TaxID=1810919 RepID=A0A3D8SCY7_9EURO|nr:hypothetical protein DSM5745_04495 [Aspergillus mulundensis]RDW84169.1 hypothetical protein DSM5745_04495 [Aspergillus mulundensis]
MPTMNYLHITSFEVSASIASAGPASPYTSILLTFSPPPPTTKSITWQFTRSSAAEAVDAMAHGPSPRPNPSTKYVVSMLRDWDINTFPNRVLLDRVAARDADLSQVLDLLNLEQQPRRGFMMYTLQETGGSVAAALKTVWVEDIVGILTHLVDRGILVRRPGDPAVSHQQVKSEIAALARVLKTAFDAPPAEAPPIVDFGPFQVAAQPHPDMGLDEVTSAHRGVKRGREM